MSRKRYLRIQFTRLVYLICQRSLKDNMIETATVFGRVVWRRREGWVCRHTLGRDVNTRNASQDPGGSHVPNAV